MRDVNIVIVCTIWAGSLFVLIALDIPSPLFGLHSQFARENQHQEVQEVAINYI